MIELVDYCLLDNKSLATPDTGLWEGEWRQKCEWTSIFHSYISCSANRDLVVGLGLRKRCFARDVFFISPSNFRKTVEVLDVSFLVIS